jgi:glc operon protein GlcG
VSAWPGSEGDGPVDNDIEIPTVKSLGGINASDYFGGSCGVRDCDDGRSGSGPATGTCSSRSGGYAGSGTGPDAADRAAEIVKAVVAEATKSPRNWKLAITVVDTHGELVYFYKMDNTQMASVTISQNKARTAVRFRRPTQIFSNLMQTPAGGYLATLDSPPPTASPGGFPLVEGGKIIGAVGCSGATGDQDAVACKAGAETVK